MKKTAGFTLIEILITISLLLIIFSVFSFQLNGWISYFKLKTDIRDLYSTLLMARQLSILNQENYEIIFNIKEKSYNLLSENGSNIQSKKLRSGIQYYKLNFKRGSIMSFTPIGTAEGGSIILNNNTGEKYILTVYSHTGRVRYSKYE